MKFKVTFQVTGKHIEFETDSTLEQIHNIVKLMRPQEEYTVEMQCEKCDGDGILITKWTDGGYPWEAPIPAEYEYCECEAGKEAELRDEQYAEEYEAAMEASYR